MHFLYALWVPSMISICPKCAGKISLPEDVDRQADCACPLCQARYSIAEVFQQDAPAITILDEHSGDDDELSFTSAEAAEPRLFAMRDGDGPDEDADSEIAAVLEDQASTASFDIELTSDNELATNSDETEFDAEMVDPNMHEAFDLDTDEFSLEFQEDDALAAVDAPTTNDDVGSVTSDEESVAVDGAEIDMADDAMSVNKETDRSPVEVVKPFDFKPSPGQVPAREFSPRIPRRGRRTISEIAKFGLGGILGLLLCQIGLWWIGQLDPLGIAPKLPDAICSLAPKSLRGSDRAMATAEQVLPMPSDNQGTSESMSPTESISPTESVPPPESFFESAETEILNEDRASAFPVNPTADRAGGSDALDAQPAAVIEPSSTFESTGNLFADSVTVPPDSIDAGGGGENGDPLTDLPSDVEVNGIDDAAVPKLGLLALPKYGRDDVRVSLQATRNALDALYAAAAAEAGADERMALLVSFYAAANDLAERTANSAPRSNLVVQEVRSFLSETSRIAVTIGKIAARRWPDSTQPGVLLAGTMSGTISKGDQYQRLQLTLLGDIPHVFDLLTPSTNVVASGDKVLVLGVRVAQPTLEIAGYTADDGPVVWTDLIVPIDG